MTIVFFVLGEKGYRTITEFVTNFGSSSVFAVVSARDRNIEKDFYDEIETFCEQSKIVFFDRSSPHSKLFPKGLYKFAIGWRWMLNESKLIVFHDSLLPKYRGFAPLVSSLINGETRLGVTALHASEKYDRGPIINQKSISITYPITINKAIDFISDVYSALVCQVYREILNGKELSKIEQVEEDATYSLWRDEDDYFINWNDSSKKIKRFCDAVCFPYEGACSYVRGRKIRLYEVEVMTDVAVESRKDHLGKIIFMEAGDPVVVCGIGLLKIKHYRFDDSGDSGNDILNFRSRFVSTTVVNT